MRFMDPCSIDCPVCGACSEQRVNDLLALQACCPHCKQAFQAEGQLMREGVDERIRFELFAEIMLCIEDALNLTFRDNELCQRLNTLTLGDIARFVQRGLLQQLDAERTAIQLVLEAAKKVVEERNATRARLQLKFDPVLPTLDATSLDKPLLESVYPNRWERAYPLPDSKGAHHV